MSRLIKCNKWNETWNNKKIRFMDIYDFGELMAQIPFNAENLYHIKCLIYGFTHDVGSEIILIPIKYGEEPTGWDTLEQDFKQMVKDVQNRWQWNEDFGYH